MALFCLSGCRRQFLRLGISFEAGTRRNSRMRSRISILGFVDISRAPLVRVLASPFSDFGPISRRRLVARTHHVLGPVVSGEVLRSGVRAAGFLMVRTNSTIIRDGWR